MQRSEAARLLRETKKQDSIRVDLPRGRVHRTSDRGMAVMGPAGTGLDVKDLHGLTPSLKITQSLVTV